MDKQVTETGLSPKEEMQELIKRSRSAQSQIENYTQEQVDELIRAMVWSVARPGIAEEIAQFTVDETQLGNYDGKFLKIQRKTRATLMDIIDDKSVGILEEDKERAIVKIAKPMGIIGALAPSTNPEATPVIKAIHAIKGRNSIIVAPHPRAKLTNKKICDLMRDAIKKCGAPEDLVIGIETPSLELTNELMAQCDRVLATGGGAMVNAAYSSGTPALGVGVGNAVITVDETADLDDAADKIKISKTLDLAASCSSDNSVILVNDIYEDMLNKFKERGGYLVNEEEKDKLLKTIWDEEGHLNTAIVAQPASKIAEMADISIPEETEFYIVPEEGWGPEHLFSGEKLSVVMALYKAENIDHAIELTNNIQSYQGQGHSCGIYSTSDDNIMKLANITKTSRVMVNQPQAASNSGNLWNGMRQTFSLGCGSWGGNGTNNNISWRDLINETWVSKPLEKTKELISDEDLFGDVMNKIN
ncbi:MAG: aldehyde dehydrogenase family protein [Pseudomonadota bacterium]|nr:aldehyde dehydrogenase family protein [Pseudomonadota bacterium]MEC9392018.1 aldehyde dehydrogenase family protein [Pseudomonadota bacterium]MEC9458931.1 aldehyde dehydrogenase family protein [Pseudomonadota bacterium]MED5437556.1 aldehyde dehydrogenase family protein [Pseudomonadota bacterium]